MTEKKNKGGRPPYEPTEKDRKQVFTMASLGLSERDMAAIMGMSNNTLRKYFETELAEGPATATFKVAQALFKQATSEKNPNVTAMFFWLKCKAGWKDGSGNNIEVAGAKNVTFNISEDDAKL